MQPEGVALSRVEASEFEAGGDIVLCMRQHNLSAHAYAQLCHRILKLSSTIANLAGSEEIQPPHLAEALHASQSSEVDDGVGWRFLVFQGEA